MSKGIILKSASHEESDEVRQANLEAVMTKAGYEVEKPEGAAPEVVAEPERDAFDTEEEFEVAHVEWQEKQEKPAAKADEDDEEEEAPKKPSRKQRAIDRATRQLQDELKETKDRLAALEGKKEAKVEAPKEQARPKRADFDTDEKYEDALLAWGTQKALADKALKDAESANKTRFDQNLANYASQLEEAKEKYEDFEEVVNQDIFIGKEAQLAILELENGAEVIYYLGRHPVAAAKLGELSPISAVMEVGRLSARLKTGSPATSDANDGAPIKPKPKVPAPVRTVNTSGTTSALTFAEIAAKPSYPGKAKDLKRAASAGR